jgi:hypothetical protein
MPDQDPTMAAIAAGEKKAGEVIARRNLARQTRAQALAAHPRRLEMSMRISIAAAPVAEATFQTAGFVVAAGDSWFDYPLHDVLTLLEDEHGYNTESAASAGASIESMAYRDGQLDSLARCIEKVKAHGAVPKAVLLSGGGDDIAGDEFGMLLNNATSPIAGWNDEIVDAVLNNRILTAYKTMIVAINTLCKNQFQMVLPILFHGYDYPVPDGRGFLGGWPFPGPWLEPGFREKLFPDLTTNVGLMHTIIDRFNEMLAKLAQDGSFPNLHYVDVRNTLSTVLSDDAYQDWWANELHPTKKGFEAVTNKFADVLKTV